MLTVIFMYIIMTLIISKYLLLITYWLFIISMWLLIISISIWFC